MESIQEKILEIINEVLKDTVSVIKMDDDLIKLGLDSIVFIRIIVTIEEVFDIEIPDEYLLITEMNTIAKLVEAVSDTLGMTI